MKRLKFLNRSNEKSRIQKALASESGMFCCIYGRRRLGKSRLLQETISNKRTVYFVGDEQEASLQREAMARAISHILPNFNKVQYPSWSVLLERWWSDAPAGSVLIIDEFPYLVKTSPELPSLIQRLLDQYQTKALHLIVCGSSQRMMHGLVLDGSAPLYGRAQEIIKIAPLKAGWIGDALSLNRPMDMLEAYSVFGGIPWYWELAGSYDSFWESINAMILDPMGILHNEPHRLLLDNMRDTVQASSVLTLVGQGCNRLSEIAARLGKPVTSLTRVMSRLLDLELLSKETPFLTAVRSSKKTLYWLNDPFLAFWFRYVEPNRSRLEAGLMSKVQSDIKKYYSHHKAWIWEKMVRDSIPHLSIADNEWMLAQRWWGAGKDRKPMELDVLSESVDGKSLLVCEVKLTANEKDIGRIRHELMLKVEQLPFVDKFENVIQHIFIVDPCIDKNHRNDITTGNQVFSVLK